MITQRIALGLLALFAVVLGTNLVTSASRFSTTYEVYDQLGLELEEFEYASPEEPIRTVLRVTNPSSQEVEVVAIELRINAGVHRVGGGETRPGVLFPPDASQAFPIPLAINDRDYVRRLGTEEIDWRVSGRILVLLDESLDPVWIPFVVRYLE